MAQARARLTAAGAALALGLGTAIVPLGAASAAPDGSGVVINEAYLDGSTSASPLYTSRWVELYNPTDAPVSLDGASLQYRSATGTANPSTVLALSGEIAPGGHYLIAGAGSQTGLAGIPEPDATTGGAFSGSRGTLILAATTSPLALPAGDAAGAPDVIDLLGYGTTNTFETEPSIAPSITTSLERAGAADTDSNAADFAANDAPTPTNAAGETEAPGGTDPDPDPEPEPDPEPLAIAEIQGTGSATPYAGRTVVTQGIVTAAYPVGGLNGYYLQTPGSGGDPDATPGASDAIFVYSPQAVGSVEVGDHLEVEGVASEYNGLTQLTVGPGGATELAEPAAAPVPVTVDWAELDEAGREALEGQLVLPTGGFTVSDTYDLNAFGELLLAAGEGPLVQPTEVARVGTPEHEAQLAENARRALVLDDGASWNYVSNATAKGSPLPYLDPSDPVRTGMGLEFASPVVLSFGFDAWRVQPVGQVVGHDSPILPVEFGPSTRPDGIDVEGDLTIATFNVLNYFATTGEERENCTYYADRAGDPVTVDDSSDPGCLVRGAAEAEDLARQEAKIVAALNELDADVVALQEIENSAALGLDRDLALASLVDALNAAGGRWDYVESPRAVPEDEDVIRLAFLYDPRTVKPVGESVILLDDPAFANAREPLAQAFTPKTGPRDVFLVVDNHFKSKGEDGATGDNVDAGQGAYNGDRTRQAEALLAFAEAVAEDRGTEKVFLAGDFNSYTREDPAVVLTDAGYVDLGDRTGEETYSFDGLAGSLDHVFASPAAARVVEDQAIWTINAPESVALEYSRHNYNVVDFYVADAFRSSDHDPVVVGIETRSRADETRDLVQRIVEEIVDRLLGWLLGLLR